MYHRIWQGIPLKSDEFVISADEKTSIQARRRKHTTLAPRQSECLKVEFEYERCGSLVYIAAWDVNRAKIFGRCEEKTGIRPFERLVSNVMSQEPYCSARKVFWIVDNGSSHRGQTSVNRTKEKWPRIVLVHLPIHASWLNQIEIYFSIIQRKILTPNYFTSKEQLRNTIFNFQTYYQNIAKPFEWKFNKNDLAKLMQMYMNYGTYGGKRYISEATLKEYTKCQFCDEGKENRRGAGFDKPFIQGYGGPTCDGISQNSFGHTGFTGTMAWADPDEGVVYIFLSNRVYPDAENKKLLKMNIRTDIQQVIYDAIKNSRKEQKIN